MLDFTKKIFCVITGASRGIGQEIAVSLAKHAKNKITFILIARDLNKLNETKIKINEVNARASVRCVPLDLSSPTACNADQLRLLLNDGEPNAHELAIVFHNAGSIGTINPVAKLGQVDWTKYYTLNMFSVTSLNSLFLEITQNIPVKIIINITSLVGRQPFKYLSMYGSGKAARDMYFKVLALEDPQVHVLNYSPGMVETEMATELVQHIRGYEDSEITQAVKENPTKLTPEQTVTKLMGILEKGLYKSGDIIDYYD